MAKNKEYNGAVVSAEFEKLPLGDQIKVYHQLGIEIHAKVEAHQKKLGDELDEFDTAKANLKINKNA